MSMTTASPRARPADYLMGLTHRSPCLQALLLRRAILAIIGRLSSDLPILLCTAESRCRNDWRYFAYTSVGRQHCLGKIPMTDKEPLKITLDDLEAEEAPAKPEAARGKLQEQAEATTRQMADAAKGLAGKVTDKLSASAADATSRTAEVAREKVGEALQEQSKAIADAVEQKIRDIDWKTEAQKGTEGGLRWLSGRLTELADRMKDQPNQPDTANQAPPKDDK